MSQLLKDSLSEMHDAVGEMLEMVLESDSLFHEILEKCEEQDYTILDTYFYILHSIRARVEKDPAYPSVRQPILSDDDGA